MPESMPESMLGPDGDALIAGCRRGRHRLASWIWLALVLVLLNPMARAQPATSRYDADACLFADRDWFVPGQMRCGTLVVPASDAAPEFRLPVLRIPSASSGRKSPVVFLNGGPGGRGIIEVAHWLQHPLLGEHDLILFDARGTGLSTPALCPGLGRHVMAALMADLDREAEARRRADAVVGCLRETGLEGREEVISTAALVEDLEAIRRAFGDERLVPYGVSYGTRAAIAYADAYPQRVAALVLDSPIPPGTGYYPDIPDTFEAALSSVFDACRSDSACARRYPDIERRYAELLARLRVAPLRVVMPATRDRPAATLVLNPRDLRLLLHQLLYGREFSPAVPALIDALARGHAGTLPLWFELGVEMRVEGIGLPAYYLTLAGEEPAIPMRVDADLAFFDSDADVFARIRGARGRASPPALTARGIGVPTLLFSGRNDPIAAPAYAQEIAAAIPGAHLLRFPDSGHAVTFSAPCAGQAIADFLRDPARTPECAETAAAMRFIVDHVDHDGLARLVQGILLPRSMWPLAPLGYAVVALLSTTLAALAAFALRLRQRAPATPPVSHMTALGALAGMLVPACWGAMLASVLTGPHPAMLLVGLPGEAVWPLRIVFLLLCLITVGMLSRAGGEWRCQRTMRRASFVAVLSANLVLMAFLAGHDLAWP